MALTVELLVSLNMEEEPHAVGTLAVGILDVGDIFDVRDILAVGHIPVEQLVEDIADIAHSPLDMVQLLDKTAAGHIESTEDCMVTVEGILKSI